MQRRDFFRAVAGAAGGLWLPHEPRRIYSFGPEVGRLYSETELRVLRLAEEFNRESLHNDYIFFANPSNFEHGMKVLISGGVAGLHVGRVIADPKCPKDCVYIIPDRAS